MIEEKKEEKSSAMFNYLFIYLDEFLPVIMVVESSAQSV